MTVFSRLFAVVLFAVFIGACATQGENTTEAEALVDKAKWTVRHFEGRPDQAARDFRRDFDRSKGVVIFPNVVKGSFVVGAEGGSGVMLARDAMGEWSYPAFYTMGAGSFGFQIGGQASQLILLLMSDEAITAVIENQGKFGGDVQVTAGTFGAGVEGATTSNVGADIIGYAYGKGAYVGASIEGAVLGRRNDLNEAYYGVAAGPREIVLENRHFNAQADTLRESLAALGPPPSPTVPVTPTTTPTAIVPTTPLPPAS